MTGKVDKDVLYRDIITHIFESKFALGLTDIPFVRDDIIAAAETLGLPRPGNIGDVVYSYRYRKALPESITSKAPEGKEWVIRGRGRAKYEFCAVPQSRILPNLNLVVTKIPEATPEIIRSNSLDDEQAVLALVRYNRLIDTFMGVTAYSLQNHLRTSVTDVGQVEVDEVYLAVDRFGVQYILPTQAKGGTDKIGVVQIEQDLAMCAEKFAGFVARPIAAQFMREDVIALFELGIQDDAVVVVRESHYKLVPNDDINDTDRALYAQNAQLPPN